MAKPYARTIKQDSNKIQLLFLVKIINNSRWMYELLGNIHRVVTLSTLRLFIKGIILKSLKLIEMR